MSPEPPSAPTARPLPPRPLPTRPSDAPLERRAPTLLQGTAFTLGALIAFLSALMLLSGLVAVGFQERAAAEAFLISAGISAFVGGGLMTGMRGMESRTSPRAVVFLAFEVWTVLPLFAALPLVLEHAGAFSQWGHAYVTAVAALTTTGALTHATGEILPLSFIFWLGFLGLFGGLLTILLAALLLATHAAQGVPVTYRAFRKLETAGASQRLSSALSLMGEELGKIFITLFLIAFLTLFLAGQSAYDAFIVSAAFLSTSGLPPDHAIVLQSGVTQLVAFLLMVCGALSFLVLSDGLRRKQLKAIMNAESNVFGALIIGFFLIVVAITFLDDGTLGEAWSMLFNAVSALTTTGSFISEGLGDTFVDPGLLVALILVLAVTGGCFASTTGGVKIIRVILLFIQSRIELRRLAHPHGVFRPKLAGRAVERSTLAGAWAVLLCILFGIGLVGLVATNEGYSFIGGITAGIAALCNVAPVFELAQAPGGVYGDLSGPLKAALVIGMVCGRLEGIALLTLLSRAYWRG